MWCSVCGWDFDESFEKGYEYGEGDICECCGTEFGCDEVARKFLRLKWIKNGAKYKYFKGKEWNLENMKKQLERLHYKYEALLPLAELISDSTEPLKK